MELQEAKVSFKGIAGSCKTLRDIAQVDRVMIKINLSPRNKTLLKPQIGIKRSYHNTSLETGIKTGDTLTYAEDLIKELKENE